MSESWEVVANTGKRMDLERGFERKAIQCPNDSTAKQLFINTMPGQQIDDGTIAFFTKGRS